jgi:hypothetical protein
MSGDEVGKKRKEKKRKCGPHRLVVEMKQKYEGDGCGRSEYERENFDDDDEIFCFEGGFEGQRVWMVSEAARLTPTARVWARP